MSDDRDRDQFQQSAPSGAGADQPATSGVAGDEGVSAEEPLADEAASEELEAQLASERSTTADPLVEALAARMRTVRDTLADDSDSPSDARFEEMLRVALGSAEPRHAGADGDPTVRRIALVPRPRDGHRLQVGRWVLGAAAAVVMLIAGFVVVRSSGEQDADEALATPSAAETDSAAEEAGVPDRGTPDAIPDAGAPEFDDGGAASAAEPVPGDAGTRIRNPGGIEFTIVVPIVSR